MQRFKVLKAGVADRSAGEPEHAKAGQAGEIRELIVVDVGHVEA